MEDAGDWLFVKGPLTVIIIAFLISLFGNGESLLESWILWTLCGFIFILPFFIGWIYATYPASITAWMQLRKERLMFDEIKEKNRQARKRGWSDDSELQKAKKLGFTLSSDYKMYLKTKSEEAKEKREARLAEEKNSNKEETGFFETNNQRIIRENEEQRKARKNAKIKAFKRKNFQEGHKQPSTSQKEKVWISTFGSCSECFDDKRELSFWWRIYPNLEVVLLCDKCAEEEGLVEEKETTNEKRSRTIPEEVKDAVWRRDEGKCTQCGSNENLEFDHIIPHSKGGANTKRNIQLLCESCNRKKSDKIG